MARRVPQPIPRPPAAPRASDRATRASEEVFGKGLAAAAGPYPIALGLLTVSLLTVGLLTVGCQRAAPGPEECVAFAESWLRGRRPATQLEADTAFDELVRRCLTEPYDRELVGCVVGGQNQDRCRVDYVRRAELRREARAR